MDIEKTKEAIEKRVRALGTRNIDSLDHLWMCVFAKPGAGAIFTGILAVAVIALVLVFA